jgi:hypothetical protein
MAKLTQRHVNSLVNELARAADLKPAQAKRVLEIFHVDKLVENANALQKVLSDKRAVSALQISPLEAEERLACVSSGTLSLQNLRLGIKMGSGTNGNFVINTIMV